MSDSGKGVQVKIAVVGKGNVGGGPADRWEKARHRGLRDREQIDGASARPNNVWCGDEEARGVVEQLIRDAGYDPIYAGGLDKAAVSESTLRFLFAIAQAGTGQFFYRMAPADAF